VLKNAIFGFFFMLSGPAKSYCQNLVDCSLPYDVKSKSLVDEMDTKSEKGVCGLPLIDHLKSPLTTQNIVVSINLNNRYSFQEWERTRRGFGNRCPNIIPNEISHSQRKFPTTL